MTRVTPAMNGTRGNRRQLGLAALTLLVGFCSVGLEAHGVSGKDAVFLQGLTARRLVR